MSGNIYDQHQMPLDDDDEDENESIASSTNEDNSSDDDDTTSLNNKSKSKKNYKTSVDADEQRRIHKKESNRLSAQRSRKRQKILETKLQERISKLRLDKASLEKRFKNGMLEILKRWPLPYQIPNEFLPIEPLLNLIHQQKKSAVNSASMSLQNVQNPLSATAFRSFGIANIAAPAPTLSIDPGNSLQAYSSIQRSLISSIMNSQRHVPVSMDSTSLANARVMHDTAQQLIGFSVNPTQHPGSLSSSLNMSNHANLSSERYQPNISNRLVDVNNPFRNIFTPVSGLPLGNTLALPRSLFSSISQQDNPVERNQELSQIQAAYPLFSVSGNNSNLLASSRSYRVHHSIIPNSTSENENNSQSRTNISHSEHNYFG